MSSLRMALYIGAAALLIAIFPWGANGFEGYYTGLRFLICGICTFGAYVSLRERSMLALPFLLVGVLFNPFIKADVNRSFWIVADLIVATGFLATAWVAPRIDAAKAAEFPLIQPSATTAEPEVATVEVSS